MGYFRRLQVSTRIPPARSSGADVGGSAAGVCRGETTHVTITNVAAVVVCAVAKNAEKRVPHRYLLRLLSTCYAVVVPLPIRQQPRNKQASVGGG